jgi:hypothetical protein
MFQTRRSEAEEHTVQAWGATGYARKNHVKFNLDHADVQILITAPAGHFTLLTCRSAQLATLRLPPWVLGLLQRCSASLLQVHEV